MAAIERTYTIPLRREWLKSVKYKRAKKAVRAICDFLMRHMKITEREDIKIGKYLNLELWKHGIKNPPSRVKVNVTKDDKGVVRAELVGAPKEEKKVEAKKGKPEAKLTDVKTAIAAAQTPAEEKKAAEKPAEGRSADEHKAKSATPVTPKAPAPAKQPSAPKQEVRQIIR